MSRFENTPRMFGGGAGGGTSFEIRCGICGTIHYKGCFPGGEEGDTTVCYEDFAGITVCDCCFEDVEESVWLLLGEIVPWATRRLKAIDHRVKTTSELLRIWRQELDCLP